MSVTEALDALAAAAEVGVGERDDFRSALAATLVKEARDLLAGRKAESEIYDLTDDDEQFTAEEHWSSFAEPRLHLGYRRIKLLEACPLGQSGTTYRGHEFHYASQIEAGDAPPLFEISDARARPLGQAGARIGTVCGSFLHLIDRTSEPADDLGRTRYLRLVEG